MPPIEPERRAPARRLVFVKTLGNGHRDRVNVLKIVSLTVTVVPYLSQAHDRPDNINYDFGLSPSCERRLSLVGCAQKRAASGHGNQ